MSGQPTEQRTVVKPTASKYVKLNVGGALFNTTIGTLTKQDSMLRAMFSGRMEVLTDSEGALTLQSCSVLGAISAIISHKKYMHIFGVLLSV